MKLTLGYSPCPNDCFIFDAIANNKIDTRGIDFEIRLADVETLNKWAMKGELDFTKLSFHAYAYAIKKYILLRSGSALGFNCGPLLVKLPGNSKPVQEMTVAIPGKFTTANFLLSLAFPQLRRKVEMVFSEIEEAVLSEKADAGLLIHENRFTYEKKGLQKILDLGEFWDRLIQSPIPLGGIVGKRSLNESVLVQVNDIIRNSVQFAFHNPAGAMAYVRQHAQEMEEEVMKKHIELYVNSYSADLGAEGEKAVKLMFSKAAEQNLFSFGTEKLMMD